MVHLDKELGSFSCWQCSQRVLLRCVMSLFSILQPAFRSAQNRAYKDNLSVYDAFTVSRSVMKSTKHNTMLMLLLTTVILRRYAWGRINFDVVEYGRKKRPPRTAPTEIPLQPSNTSTHFTKGFADYHPRGDLPALICLKKCE